MIQCCCFLRIAHAGQRSLDLHAVQFCLTSFGVSHWRIHGVRANAVDADVSWCQLQCRHLGQANDGDFAHNIRPVSGIIPICRIRCGIKNRASIIHVLLAILEAEDNAHDVDVEQCFISLLVRIFQSFFRADDAGVIYNDVQFAVSFGSCLHQVFYSFFLADIRLDEIKRYIDILAYYKMNRFQFHFTDDEAWRVEIPGLPELTEVASRRGCTLDEKGYLAQIFDGNGNPDDPAQSANGYLTRKQFVEILKYAHQRGVKVIPEIETPGHARAAIIAMRNRYDKYIGTDRTLAEQFKLWDDHDASVYTSAQSYHDNVLNVASDGVYNFITHVVTELQKMYKDAGLKLDIVHLGGDEVASGAWSQSPDVQALMQREHLKDNHEVNGYYIRRITDILYKRGIRIEGWQEVAQNHSDEFNRQMAPRFAGINAWSTVGSRDIVPYSIANDGYPVILSNVTNFYMDMGYNWHPYEQGLHWGGKVDEFDSWSALPWNVYASARMAYDGSAIDVATNHQGKVALTQRQNIIGIQAQMWGETIRNFDQVQRMWFPKVFGVVERGWNAQPDWSLDLANTAPYDSARHQYNLKIGTRELPLLHRMGYNFRLGQPGLKVENGMLLANALYPGVTIRYTLDGSEPTQSSPVWTAPVKLATIPPVIKARAYYLGKESVTTLLFAR